MDSVTDLTERLRKGALVRASQKFTYELDGVPIEAATGEVSELCHPDALEAATTLETLTQENARLRGLLIDPGDPAWEDARGVLVAELRKTGFNGAAKQIGEGEGCNIPSWVALNLIAHSRKSLTQENARLRETLGETLRVYVELVESGDAGFWDPEEEPHVMAARKALGGGDE